MNRAGSVVMLCALVLGAASAEAQVAQLCQDSLAQDRQGPFTSSMLTNASAMKLTSNSRLQLDTNLTPLDAERIYFPFTQHVTISYVYESAGASHALGYVYLRDLRERGYVDANGNLRDTNTNGIYDLHEDIFNLAPSTSTRARPYVGTTRRCSRTFNSGGFTYSEPELGMNRNCAATFQASRSYNGRNIDFIGQFSEDPVDGNGFSDNGLHARVPNLLEPAHPNNGNEGLGRVVFLLADDDGDTSVHRSLSPVNDGNASSNGVPDYDVSAYDATGLQRATNPDTGITTFDRTVNLGTIEGGEELVFFLVVWHSADFQPSGGQIYPCLRKNTSGQCTLHLRSSTNVYFSKSAWNLDQDILGTNPVAERNIGCGYAAGCNRDNPSGSSSSCPVTSGPGTGTRLCGWLDSATLSRLNTAAYNNLSMPMERARLPRPANGAMPHVMVGAPSTDPYRWILGFEDLPGGGDRDFNDVVVMINKINGGGMRSGLMSSDLSPEIADDFSITKVRFKRADDNTRKCATAPCFTAAVPGACALNPPPTIDYHVAVDCRLKSGNTWTDNPNPSWVRVPFASPVDPNNPQTEVELDFVAMGIHGSQLCWQVTMTSPNERCTPTVDRVEVGYQAVRAGVFTRAAPSTLGNAIVYGGYQTPGQRWGNGWPSAADSTPPAGLRAYDDRRDWSTRGQLYLKSLYDPEAPDRTNVQTRWSAGRVLALQMESAADPMTRRLYTMAADGTRVEVKDLLGDDASTSPLFPDSLCDVAQVAGRDPFDLNRDGACRTITHPNKRTGDTHTDRHFFREWLYGWEDMHDPPPARPAGSNTRRRWPLGGIQHSTVNLLLPPYMDPFALTLPSAERDRYRRNFVEPLQSRASFAFVGTMDGFLHAFDAGAFRAPSGQRPEDDCGHGALRGFFAKSGQCGTAQSPGQRRYGTGQEAFAFLPRGLLSQYVNAYPQYFGSTSLPRPSMNASATVANVDFGIIGQPAWTRETGAPTRTQGAKTVLVSSTGASSPVLFALDVTNPDRPEWPFPLWEYSLQNTALLSAFNTAPLLPDHRGGRHAPSVGRMKWGGDTAWMAAFATDYSPATGRAGAVYLMDLKTGAPKQQGNAAFAGVVTLERGFGVAGPPALVDVDLDGTYDLAYVPSTSGKVWRLNLSQLDPSRPAGSVVSKCAVADAPVDLALRGVPQPAFQQLHSNVAVKVERGPDGPSVRLYFGTGDNPDDATDGPAQRSSYRWHLMAYEDRSPLSQSCTPAQVLYTRALAPGHAVWGGVMLSDSEVLLTTAVGAAADACNLSQTESGVLVVTKQQPTVGNLPAPGTSDQRVIGGHGISPPVVHDDHVFVLGADGTPRMVGEDNWNNDTALGGNEGTRVLIWKSRQDGRLPR